MADYTLSPPGLGDASAVLQEREYLLRLYIAGTTPRSARAVLNIQRICETHLAGRYHLEVIDIYQQAALARDEQIIAVPTLIRYLPPPLRRLIGDLSNTERVLMGLELQAKHGAEEVAG